MDFIWESITDWLKEILISGIVSNLSGMFDSTNEQVGNIIGQVGMTPQSWNSGIFTMMHCFRHSLATTMLEKGVPLPVISQTLGHADISSTEVYLRINISQLRLCALEVEL